MLRFGEMFEDHAVLQRGKTIPVWGESDAEGASVRVRLGCTEAVGTVSGGRFRTDLPAAEAGGPYTLSACCGQFLMQYPHLMHIGAL